MRLNKSFAFLLPLAALACLLLAAGVAQAAPAGGKKLRVAFVLLETINDQGWTTSHHEGIEHLKKQLGDQVEVSYTENALSPADAERIIRNYARQGYDLIFGTTFTHMEPMYKVAGEFPNVKFMHCAGFKTRPNMGTYMVRIEQGEYLAGYAAGLMGYKNVGTVATQPIPEVVRGINAFTLGLKRGLDESKAKYDADKLNTIVWLKAWRDAVNETTLAEVLAAKKHDLIRQMADTSDSSKAACAKGVPAVGYGVSAAKYGAACVLTSTTFEWGAVYVDVVKKVLAGTWRNDQMFTGFEAGSVGLAPFGKAVPKAVADKVLALKARMAKGEDMSFAGPIVDQAGAERVRKGEKATDKELLSMRWFVKGVSGKLPE
ncbi:MAG TPA: BMP family ABC transporter substrate-binding protein [Humidesulfovibrio sp.]|uniref:BMP family ABC transporter substrate-binding protein n=1 Tax=Humidesulfovibrio sp. TaxID=2910988 RepID=UPI002BF2D072|nr:BMP family ABC transporter substrate-binding protein [Humidesulfovibrio sp.]HWR03814.1 BMP family ABC transporter substrate-binding protein [Humidesulfovibrio sp.]